MSPEYENVLGKDTSSWVAWASSPSSCGFSGSDGMLVTVTSSTTDRWSDRENTGTPDSSLNAKHVGVIKTTKASWLMSRVINTKTLYGNMWDVRVRLSLWMSMKQSMLALSVFVLCSHSKRAVTETEHMCISTYRGRGIKAFEMGAFVPNW